MSRSSVGFASGMIPLNIVKRTLRNLKTVVPVHAVTALLVDLTHTHFHGQEYDSLQQARLVKATGTNSCRALGQGASAFTVLLRICLDVAT